MRAGHLRHRITYQVATKTATSLGSTSAWVDAFTLWGKATLGPQSESGGERDLRTQTVEIEHRYNRAITQDMRAVYNGIAYDVTSATDEEGRRRQTIVRGEVRS